MDTQEVDDLTEDGDEVRDYRARARTELDQIARQAKQALAEQKIGLTILPRTEFRARPSSCLAPLPIPMT